MKVVRLTNIPAMFSATQKIRVLISFNLGTFFLCGTTELSHAKLGET